MITLANVFLVDDDRAIIEVYHNMLEIRGHKVIGEAYDGEQAVSIYKEMTKKPDIILMDHRMPFKNGLSAMQDIWNVNPSQCIIFTTADFTAAKDALKKGAQSFILKPFRMDDLFNSIETALTQEKRRGLELKEEYMKFISMVGDGKKPGKLAKICDGVEKKIIDKYIPTQEQKMIEPEIVLKWMCDFFNTMGLEFSFENMENSYVIKNNKCVWMNDLGPNPSFCFMTRCIISKFAVKTGRDFELLVNRTIMDGTGDCVFELNFI